MLAGAFSGRLGKAAAGDRRTGWSKVHKPQWLGLLVACCTQERFSANGIGRARHVVHAFNSPSPESTLLTEDENGNLGKAPSVGITRRPYETSTVVSSGVDIILLDRLRRTGIILLSAAVA